MVRRGRPSPAATGRGLAMSISTLTAMGVARRASRDMARNLGRLSQRAHIEARSQKRCYVSTPVARARESGPHLSESADEDPTSSVRSSWQSSRLQCPVRKIGELRYHLQADNASEILCVLLTTTSSACAR